MPGLTVEIITAEHSVLSGEATMVVAPTTEGVIGILPRHASLLTTLAPGVMILKKEGGSEESLAVAGGFLEVNHDRVLVLADTAEREDDIDEERAVAARTRAEEALREAARHPDAALRAEAARTALRRSLARLNVVQRKRRRRPTS